MDDVWHPSCLDAACKPSLIRSHARHNETVIIKAESTYQQPACTLWWWRRFCCSASVLHGPATPALSVPRLWDVGCLRFEVKICGKSRWFLWLCPSILVVRFLKVEAGREIFHSNLETYVVVVCFHLPFQASKASAQTMDQKTCVPSPADGFCSKKRMAVVIGSRSMHRNPQFLPCSGSWIERFC